MNKVKKKEKRKLERIYKADTNTRKMINNLEKNRRLKTLRSNKQTTERGFDLKGSIG